MTKFRSYLNHMILTAAALVATSQIASAQDLGARATVWRTYLTAVLNLLPVAAAIAGFGLLITAGVKLAKHNADPRENSMKAVMLYGAGGLILVLLGGFVAFGAGTLFGGGGNTGGDAGVGTFTLN